MRREAHHKRAHTGDLLLDGALRAPWASKPRCQSCHTDDAFTPNHPANAVVAPVSIHLLQAYETRLLNVPNVPQAARYAPSPLSNADGYAAVVAVG